jgi:hypothetical protein
LYVDVGHDVTDRSPLEPPSSLRSKIVTPSKLEKSSNSYLNL